MGVDSAQEHRPRRAGMRTTHPRAPAGAYAQQHAPPVVWRGESSEVTGAPRAVPRAALAFPQPRLSIRRLCPCIQEKPARCRG